MSEDQLTAIMARTDASVGLLVQILINKGVISEHEMELILENAVAAIGQIGPEGKLIESAFLSINTLMRARPNSPKTN